MEEKSMLNTLAISIAPNVSDIKINDQKRKIHMHAEKIYQMTREATYKINLLILQICNMQNLEGNAISQLGKHVSFSEILTPTNDKNADLQISVSLPIITRSEIHIKMQAINYAFFPDKKYNMTNQIIPQMLIYNGKKLSKKNQQFCECLQVA